jgi:hypothetical protein
MLAVVQLSLRARLVKQEIGSGETKLHHSTKMFEDSRQAATSAIILEQVYRPCKTCALSSAG